MLMASECDALSTSPQPPLMHQIALDDIKGVYS
jgi:hypothetical protein